jgi:CTP:molybdopterin cytidylyltransferase MocA
MSCYGAFLQSFKEFASIRVLKSGAMSLAVVVLAAGQGKRMHSVLPKVLHRLAGRPLLAHVLDTARTLKPKQILVVHGHGGAEVRSAFDGEKVEWVEQAKQLGTGHALAQALPKVARGALVLVLNGDVPLVRAETLQRLVDASRGGLAICTSDLTDAAGYGRVVRDARKRVRRVVEHGDASASELRIREWYAGSLRQWSGWRMAGEGEAGKRAKGVLPHRRDCARRQGWRRRRRGEGARPLGSGRREFAP